MKKILILFLLIACTYDPGGARYVVDGDTFALNNGSRVRLQSIDSPEQGERYYDKAAYELQRRLIGRELRLEGNETDKYGRLLRHVFADGKHVNLEIVEQGWAKWYESNSKYEALIEKKQAEAIALRIGIWEFNDEEYRRFSERCKQYGCQHGSIAVASKYGQVFYNCRCGMIGRIVKENIICFSTIQDAIAMGLRETKRC